MVRRRLFLLIATHFHLTSQVRIVNFYRTVKRSNKFICRLKAVVNIRKKSLFDCIDKLFIKLKHINIRDVKRSFSTP